MIEIKNISKQFNTPEGTVEALKNVSLSIPDGDIFGIIGMSGAGKSTLVRCINMLERPTCGSVEIDGVDLCTLPESKLRNKVFPHNLRHLFARAFYGIEKDIAKLADILGHSLLPVRNINNIKTKYRRGLLPLRYFYAD